jgi:hypothetical protein
LRDVPICLHSVRSGSLVVPRSLLGLAGRPADPRGFPTALPPRSTQFRRTASAGCRPSWSSLSFRAWLPIAPVVTDLLSWDSSRSGFARRSCDLLQIRRTVPPLHRPAPRRPLPRRCRHRRFGSRSTTSEVLFRPRGFAPPRRFSPPFAPLPGLPPGRAETRFRMGVAGLLHPAADQGSPRFRFRSALAHHQRVPGFPATRTPFEGIPQPQPYPVTRATCLPDVFVPRSPDLPPFPLPVPTLSHAPEARSSPRLFSIAGYVPTVALCRRRLACPPVGFCSPHRFYDRRSRLPAMFDEGPIRLHGSSPFRERPFLHALSLPPAVPTCSRRALGRAAHSVPPLSRDPARLKQARAPKRSDRGIARVTDEP